MKTLNESVRKGMTSDYPKVFGPWQLHELFPQIWLKLTSTVWKERQILWPTLDKCLCDRLGCNVRNGNGLWPMCELVNKCAQVWPFKRGSSLTSWGTFIHLMGYLHSRHRVPSFTSWGPSIHLMGSVHSPHGVHSFTSWGVHSFTVLHLMGFCFEERQEMETKKTHQSLVRCFLHGLMNSLLCHSCILLSNGSIYRFVITWLTSTRSGSHVIGSGYKSISTRVTCWNKANIPTLTASLLNLPQLPVWLYVSIQPPGIR